MNPNESILDKIRTQLGALRERPFAAVENLKALLETPRAFLPKSGDQPVEFRVEGHLDVKASLLIHDAELGTLGLVHLVEPTDDEAKWRQWFRDCIDEAVYLRHLLLVHTRPQQESDRPIAYTIELVFVQTEQSTAATTLAGKEMRKLMREGPLLHAVGVNFWRWPIDDERHRRTALAWLLDGALHCFKVWQDEDWRQRTSTPQMRFRGVKLENFRAIELLSLKLHRPSTMHLVHGHNGSGKSSFVEALELLLSGTLDRLHGVDDYTAVLRNRHFPKSTAKIAVTWEEEDRSEQTREGPVIPTGFDTPFGEKIIGDSFRLDQKLAEELAIAKPSDLAATFLAAFFGDKSGAIEERRTAHKRLDTEWNALPEATRSSLAAHTKVKRSDASHAAALSQLIGNASESGTPFDEAFIPEFDWLEESQLDWQRVLGLWSLEANARSLIQPLLAQGPAQRIDESGVFTWDEVLVRASELDGGINGLRARLTKLRELLPEAASVLSAATALSLEELAVRQREIPQIMNDWLEATAAADLIEKAHEVAACVQLVSRQTGYDLDPELASLLDKPWRKADLAAMRALSQRLAERLGALNAQLATAGTSGAAGATARTAAMATSPDEKGLKALDSLASDGVFGDEFVHCRPTLSAAVRIACKELRPVEVLQGDRVALRVGAPGWAARLTGAIEAVRERTSSLDLSNEAVPRLRAVIEQLRKVLAAAREVQKTDVKVILRMSELLEADGPLLAALNEVITMLTPARWAYSTLSAATQLERDQRLEFRDEDKVRAALRLNTAELNTLSLAFFLLGARRGANPLRLLVLDDPLHNMDELTVTTVARGISKMLRLWAALDSAGADAGAAPWQVLLLLHGEEDAERFREEVPCAFYRLPWLLPSQEGAPATDEVPMKPSRLRQKFQTLAELVTEVTEV
ncbi:MAG TPA: ATP-binding protein [Terrimicrobiaceae bacterium]